MFDDTKTSLGHLDEYEFENLVGIVEDKNLDEWFEEYYFDEPDDLKQTPPDWLRKWTGSLEISSLSTLDCGNVWSFEKIICDNGANESYLFSKYPDNTLRRELLPVGSSGLTADLVWPHVRRVFDEYGKSLLYGDLTIQCASLLPRKFVEAYLTEKMKQFGLSEVGGKNLGSWLESNYTEAR